MSVGFTNNRRENKKELTSFWIKTSVKIHYRFKVIVYVLFGTAIAFHEIIKFS